MWWCEADQLQRKAAGFNTKGEVQGVDGVGVYTYFIFSERLFAE